MDSMTATFTKPLFPHVEILHESSRSWLDGRAFNDTSQFGEDGLIEACLEKFGVQNQMCFEVGAADGLFFSNTKRLRDKGWRALLIERDRESFDKLVKFQSETVKCVRADVTDTPLDSLLLSEFQIPDIDLGIIDIDGQDVFVWEDMKLSKPRIMLVEILPKATEATVNRGDVSPLQAGLNQVVECGTRKGYTLLAKTFCNALFCRTELL